MKKVLLKLLLSFCVSNSIAASHGDSNFLNECSDGVFRNIQSFINQGGDVNMKDAEGKTPLHFAALYGNSSAIYVLVYAGAHIEERDEDGNTPLYWAVYYNNRDAIMSLINCGANINHTGIDEVTLFQVAQNNQQLEIINLLNSGSRSA